MEDDLYWWWDEAQGCYVRVVRPRTRFDLLSRRWVCRCERFALFGTCFHISRWRPQVEVRVLECYL